MFTTTPAGRWTIRHETDAARSGPPPDRSPGPAPPPPPAGGAGCSRSGCCSPWRCSCSRSPPPARSSSADSAAGQVASVALGPDGRISGTLTNGTTFTSGYPTSLQDPQFAQLLDQHNVQVTTQPAQNSILAGLLTLVLAGSVLAAARRRKGHSASAGRTHPLQVESSDRRQ
jgi:hypothetical protein